MGSLSLGNDLIHSVIVDDDKSIGGILKELVEKDGVSVDVFSDSSRAVAYLSKTSADIVITDLMMGDVGGLDILRCARQRNPDVVVIIITGHASLETAIQAVRDGAYDYIKKPFKLREMELAFEKAVEKVRLVQKNRALVQALKDANDELDFLRKEAERKIKKARVKKEEHDFPLRFYSSSSPNLTFFPTPRESHAELLQRLDNIVNLKRTGHLTENEFQAIKAHILKSLNRFDS